MSTTATPADGSGIERATERSLKTAGWAYLVGDAALVAAGIAEKSYSTAAAGALYSASGMVLARYGNPEADKRLQLLYQDLGKYLKAQGVEIPKGSKVDAAMLAEKGGVIDHIERFLYRHPSQAFNALFAVGGVQLFSGGFSQKRPWKAASGALVTAGGLAGLLIPERKPEPDDKDKDMLTKAWHWLQEKPLRASGALYMANNVTLTVDALKNRKNNHPYSPLFQLLTVASYVVGNIFLATSLKKNTASKNHDAEQSSTQELEHAAAEIIAAQPKAVQQKIIREVAGYLSAQTRVHVTAEELAGQIQSVVDEHAQYTKASWSGRLQNVPEGPSPAL